jgi:putative membrane protein
MRRMRFLIRSAVTAVAVWFVTILPFDVAVEGGEDQWWTRLLVFLGVGIVIEALNAFVRPILTFLSLPFLILTLGLFYVFIAWAVLWLASWITGIIPGVELTLGGFWDTLFAALVLAITTAILSFLVPAAHRDN